MLIGHAESDIITVEFGLEDPPIPSEIYLLDAMRRFVVGGIDEKDSPSIELDVGYTKGEKSVAIISEGGWLDRIKDANTQKLHDIGGVALGQTTVRMLYRSVTANTGLVVEGFVLIQNEGEVPSDLQQRHSSYIPRVGGVVWHLNGNGFLVIDDSSNDARVYMTYEPGKRLHSRRKVSNPYYLEAVRTDAEETIRNRAGVSALRAAECFVAFVEGEPFTTEQLPAPKDGFITMAQLNEVAGRIEWKASRSLGTKTFRALHKFICADTYIKPHGVEQQVFDKIRNTCREEFDKINDQDIRDGVKIPANTILTVLLDERIKVRNIGPKSKEFLWDVLELVGIKIEDYSAASRTQQ